jgi:hypothetical protein
MDLDKGDRPQLTAENGISSSGLHAGGYFMAIYSEVFFYLAELITS